MAIQLLMTEAGVEYEVTLSESGAIERIDGPPMPTGGVVFKAPIPAHVHPKSVPAAILNAARALGRKVCFYDPNCQTCYCDEDGRMVCVPEC